MVVRQQGDKLVAVAPNSEEVELSPQSTADTFIALPPQAIVRFERDPAGKISGIVITMPNGREIRGKRTQ
jgi:hypothetical protein